jgi:hypothetical protein
MFDRTAHISDEELVLSADNELSVPRRFAVRAHLSACWTCRARMQELQQTIADVASVQRENLDRQPLDFIRVRSKLQGRIEELSNEPAPVPASRFFRALAGQWSYAFALALVLFASVWILRRSPDVLENLWPGRAQFSALPNPRLTPGAVRPVTVAEVCSVQREEVIRTVPAGLQAQVFREYGLRRPKQQDFEVDYLITPGLGGADQISNLWPEPYSGTWNARLKDMLEERLHEMVCKKQITLESAQREIATDWIAAYKKYVPASQSASNGNSVEHASYALLSSR